MTNHNDIIGPILQNRTTRRFFVYKERLLVDDNHLSLRYYLINIDRMSTANAPAGNLRKRKSQTVLNSEKIANGQSTAMMKINARPTEHGQEMDKKLDEHES